MAILTLDDGSARVEVVVFGELFHEKRSVVQEDQVIVVKGRIFPDEFSGGLRITADQLMDLAEVRAAHARLLRLCINGQADSAKLKSLLAQYAGGKCHVAIRYRNAQGRMRHSPPRKLQGEGIGAAPRLARGVARREERRSRLLGRRGPRPM